MKPEVLLKAYVLYRSDDAFRELVAGSLDKVYSTALRIVGGPPHLVEETVLRVYWDLARKGSRLRKHIELDSWLHDQTCKAAVDVLHEANRSIDHAVLKEEKRGIGVSDAAGFAPPGLATRVCQGIILNAARPRSLLLSLPRIQVRLPPYWTRVGAAALCVLVAVVILWKVPFHKSNPIVQSPELRLTPASFAQLASPEEGAVEPPRASDTNAQTQASRK